VTIITDPVELEKWKEEAWRSYEERDLKMADLTDEAVDTFYTCSLCQSFAPDHICIISPERLGLCGAVNWMDCKASKEIAPTGPNQPVPKTGVIDERIGQWEGVNQAVREYSHGKIEIFNQYSLMKYPMTSCGCFECIVAMTADAQGFIVVNREYGGMTPIGMKFTTLAGSVGGGKQTPGFLGIGRKFIVSPKFIRAEDGFKRLMWMPKQLKEDMRELMEKRAKELGIPNFLDKIADETNVTDPAQLMEWCIEVGHPAMALPNLMEFM